MKMTEHTTLLLPVKQMKIRQAAVLHHCTPHVTAALQALESPLPKQRIIQSPHPIPSLWLSISIEITISCKVRFQDVVIKNRVVPETSPRSDQRVKLCGVSQVIASPRQVQYQSPTAEGCHCSLQTSRANLSVKQGKY